MFGSFSCSNATANVICGLQGAPPIGGVLLSSFAHPGQGGQLLPTMELYVNHGFTSRLSRSKVSRSGSSNSLGIQSWVFDEAREACFTPLYISMFFISIYSLKQ
jgi:hypothetical protein